MKALTILKGTLLGFLSLTFLPMYASAYESAKAESQMTTKLSDGTQSMAFRLLSELSSRESNKNILISPLSIAAALTLTLNGAAKTTASEMAQMLGLSGVPLDKVNEGNGQIFKLMQSSDPKVQLFCANALWVKQETSLKPDFVERAKNYFNAKVAVLNFSDGKSVSIINDWVNNATKGKIKSIIDSLDRTTPLVITNGVYFKADWTVPFQIGATDINGQFTTDTGEHVRVPMMRQGGHFLYHEDANLQTIKLPYGNGRTGMYILLPRAERGLNPVIASLTPATFKQIDQSMSMRVGSLRLPRFTINACIDLSRTLQALGMKLAFDRDLADFSNMAHTSPPIYVGAVLHKAVINVNEQGTEAGAATAVVMAGATMMRPEKPFEMNVDHPFLIVVHDLDSDEILFLGAVVKPEPGEKAK